MKISRGHGCPGWFATTAWLLLTFWCLAAVVYGVRIWRMAPTVDVVVRMSSTIGGPGQFFPLGEGGYSEQSSIHFTPRPDGEPHDYAAQLTGLAAGAFRLDPGAGAGTLALYSIEIRNKYGEFRLEGPALEAAVQPLHQLASEGAGDGLRFRSEGPDPYLQVAVPSELLDGHRRYRWRAAVIGFVGAATLLLLAWFARSRFRTFIATGDRRSSAGFFCMALIGTLVLLGALGTGCGGLCGADGAWYGARLLLAALALATIGAASLRPLGLLAYGAGRLFLCVAAGQLVLLLYVYARSALQAVLPAPPLGFLELGIIVVAALAYLWLTRPDPRPQLTSRAFAWPAIELALLAAVCIVVADRELPRLVMLSSDPDTHAYLARQVELLGAIPWHGEASFGYPGGTAALGFIWAKLAQIDVRDSVTALPLLQSFLAALMLGEALSTRTRSPSVRLVVMLTAIGITAAGFLIPLYWQYSHMEGAGRQMAIGIAAIMAALLLSGGPSRGQDRKLAPVLTASLFALAVLNPISVVVPAILAVGWIVYQAIAHRRISWWLLGLAALPLLMLLDPYYFRLLTEFAPPASKITVNDRLQVKSLQEILTAWRDYYVANPLRLAPGGWTMGPAQAVPLFAGLLATILGLRLILRPALRVRVHVVVAVGLVVLALLAAEGLFAALADDRRFYLLAPYYAFTLGQLKILLVTAMAGGVILLGRAQRLNALRLAIPAILLVLVVRLGMHEAQRFTLNPRADYCGSMGCASPDDIAVMTRFATMLRQSHGTDISSLPRILVPNSVHDTRNEDWVFPVTGARALPFYDVPPVAFFYYQGDDDYTTEAYKAHVCRRFDRDWLAAQGIGYVFLPTARGAACMDGMEQLPATEEILVRSGDSYLIRLRNQ